MRHAGMNIVPRLLKPGSIDKDLVSISFGRCVPPGGMLDAGINRRSRFHVKELGLSFETGPTLFT